MIKKNKCPACGQVIRQGRAVVQDDPKSIYLQNHVSISAASLDTGVDRSSIWKVCNGLRETAGGYKWRYK